MAERPSRLLRDWLQRQLPEAGFDWLAGQLETLQRDPSDRKLHIALGMVPRRLGKDDLALSEADLRAAEAARPGWDPRGWSVDEAARILALLATAGANTAFAERFTELCSSAEVGEAIALYRGLPLYPDPAALEAQAAEGLRTNMRAVFEAVAHRTPFPRERFGEDRWNQMVLKALFIGSALHPIQGLDQRANPALAAILIDYAQERRAASRPVSPELWRCVGPFAKGAAGNLATEDLVLMAEKIGYDTGVDLDALWRVVRSAEAMVGKETGGRTKSWWLSQEKKKAEQAQAAS